MTTKISQGQIVAGRTLTLAEAVADTQIAVGDSVTISDRAHGVFDVVLASSVTPNTYWIVQCVGVPTLALVKRKSEKAEFFDLEADLIAKVDIQEGEFAIVGGDAANNDGGGKRYIIQSSVGDILLDNGLYAAEYKERVDAIETDKPDAFDIIYGINLANERYSEFLARNIKQKLKSSVRFSDGVITANTHIGDDDWREFRLTNSGEVDPGVDSPYKVTNERIYKSEGWLTVKDATQGGTWSTFTAGSNIYVGHQVAQSNSASNTLTWTGTFGGDLSLGFTGDTDGGIVEVSVDGGAAVDVDTYSATANDYRQFRTIASGLEVDSHTIVVTSTNRKNASSSGTQANITSLKIQNGGIAPYGDLYQAKPWKSGVTVRDWEEVQGPTGSYYNCSVGGTTGATAPTHTSGTVSDGTVSWTFQSSTSFSDDSQTISTYGSEREYKYDCRPVGQSGYEDIGGNLHGNEFLKSDPVFLVSGEAVDISGGDDFTSDSIAIVQSITNYYGPFASKIDVADVSQNHAISGGVLDISIKFDVLTDLDRRSSFACMWPFLTYASNGFTKNFTKFSTPRAVETLSDHEGVTLGLNQGNKKDFWVEAVGRAYPERGSGGTPSSDNGKTGLRIALKVNSQDVQNYSLSDVNAALAVNLNGGSYTGYSSWLSKMYLEDVGSSEVRHLSGDTYSIGAQYLIELYPNEEDISSL
jgi:hypothetical protein